MRPIQGQRQQPPCSSLFDCCAPCHELLLDLKVSITGRVQPLVRKSPPSAIGGCLILFIKGRFYFSDPPATPYCAFMSFTVACSQSEALSSWRHAPCIPTLALLI